MYEEEGELVSPAGRPRTATCVYVNAAAMMSSSAVHQRKIQQLQQMQMQPQQFEQVQQPQHMQTMLDMQAQPEPQSSGWEQQNALLEEVMREQQVATCDFFPAGGGASEPLVSPVHIIPGDSEANGHGQNDKRKARAFLPPSTVAYLKQWMMSPQVRVLLASCFLRTRRVFFFASLSA
jgi:hypothetical protein